VCVGRFSAMLPRLRGYLAQGRSWTADHVIIAAQILHIQRSHVACSRARKSCILHTPNKARLTERLPEGNRRAALDVLSEM
jgi:hypothetical protein